MLSENIRKYRKANHMSQDELAEKLHVTRQSVSLWETGQTQPSLDSVVALATIFQISTDDLLRADVETNAPQKPQEQPAKKISLGWVIAIGLIVVAALLVAIILWGSTSDTDHNIDSMTITVNQSSASDLDDGTNPTDEPAVSTTTEETKGKPQLSIYEYLKDFVIANGTINGDYCYVGNTTEAYGGYRSEDFTLSYWGDTDTIEFCLHRVIDDMFSINFYLYVPQEHTGTYEYRSSYYYRENGESLYFARGTIEAGEFTKNHPLRCTNYIGSADQQTAFMETSRKGICELLACLEQFMIVEGLEYSFEDLGFTKF